MISVDQHNSRFYSLINEFWIYCLLPAPWALSLEHPHYLLSGLVRAPSGVSSASHFHSLHCHAKLSNREHGHVIYLLNIFTRLCHFWINVTFILTGRSLPGLASVCLLEHTSCLLPYCILWSNHAFLVAVQTSCAFSFLLAFASAVPITWSGLLCCPDPSLPGKHLSWSLGFQEWDSPRHLLTLHLESLHFKTVMVCLSLSLSASFPKSLFRLCICCTQQAFWP